MAAIFQNGRHKTDIFQFFPLLNRPDVLTRIKELLRAKTKSLKSERRWRWWIYYRSLSEKSASATGRCTLTLCQKCCATGQLLGTTPTPNQPTSVCIGWASSRMNVKMYTDNLKKGYIFSELRNWHCRSAFQWEICLFKIDLKKKRNPWKNCRPAREGQKFMALLRDSVKNIFIGEPRPALKRRGSAGRGPSNLGSVRRIEYHA